MKRKLFILLLALGLWLPGMALYGSSQASAADIFPVCDKGNSTGVDASGTNVCKDVKSTGSTNPVIRVLRIAISIIALAIGVAAVVVIIVSALKLVLGGGDPKEVQSARSGIIYALVGLVVAVVAQSLVAFVLNKL